jgi:hypothetical protein
MSAEATGWVWRHAPYRGATLLVALAVADVVNDVHGNEFWMAVPRLAEKSRVSLSSAKEALARLVADGILEVVEAGGATRTPTRYRWTRPVSGLVDATTRPVSGLDKAGERPSTRPVSGPNTNKELKGTQAARLLASDPLDAAFAEVWARYPRKEGKKAALRAYVATRRKGIEHATILRAVTAYAAERERERDPDRRRRFTKHAATFLGPDEPWRDYVTAAIDLTDDRPSDDDLLRGVR